jgi:hypothetical protein
MTVQMPWPDARGNGTFARGRSFFRMAQDQVTEPAAFEPQVEQLVRRMADRLDGALDPNGESKAIVAEALMRLAMAVYINSQGAEHTRDRLLAFALLLDTPSAVH